MNEEWGSYLPSLFSCLLATKGPVLEVGVGDISTPILRAFCSASKRPLVSIEDDDVWRAKLGVMWHTDSLATVLTLHQWSVVFLDHSPGGQRAAAANLFPESAEFIVVHDWSAPDVSEPFQPILQKWPFQKVDERFHPHTLVLGRREIP